MASIINVEVDVQGHVSNDEVIEVYSNVVDITITIARIEAINNKVLHLYIVGRLDEDDGRAVANEVVMVILAKDVESNDRLAVVSVPINYDHAINSDIMGLDWRHFEVVGRNFEGRINKRIDAKVHWIVNLNVIHIDAKEN